MSEINVSIDGAVETVPGDASAFSLFSLSFSVDGSTPIANRWVFDVFVPLQNFILTVGGHTYTAATGEIWGESPFFNGVTGACCSIDIGVSLNQPGFLFGWTAEGGVSQVTTVGEGTTLGASLVGFGQMPVSRGEAGFSVTDPPAQASVPEPSVLLLLVLPLIVLIWKRR